MKAFAFFQKLAASSAVIAALASPAGAATLKTMSCNAYNAFGVATLTLDPKTQVVTSVINFGQAVLRYNVLRVEAQHRPVEGYAASGAGIELQTYGLKDNRGQYKLLFTESLKPGAKQRTSGELIHYTRDERGADEDASPLPADLVTHIALVTCDLELAR